MLVDALNERDIDDAHMAAPEVLGPLDLAGFRFSSQDEDDQAHPDPRISAYLDSREDEAIDLKLLKADRLIALRTDGETYREWPVYRGLVYEVTLDADLYVLTGGDWFRINVDFKQRVYDYVDALDRRRGLPPADADTDEDHYNVKAAAALDAVSWTRSSCSMAALTARRFVTC